MEFYGVTTLYSDQIPLVELDVVAQDFVSFSEEDNCRVVSYRKLKYKVLKSGGGVLQVDISAIFSRLFLYSPLNFILGTCILVNFFILLLCLTLLIAVLNSSILASAFSLSLMYSNPASKSQSIFQK